MTMLLIFAAAAVSCGKTGATLRDRAALPRKMHEPGLRRSSQGLTSAGVTLAFGQGADTVRSKPILGLDRLTARLRSPVEGTADSEAFVRNDPPSSESPLRRRLKRWRLLASTAVLAATTAGMLIGAPPAQADVTIGGAPPASGGPIYTGHGSASGYSCLPGGGAKWNGGNEYYIGPYPGCNPNGTGTAWNGTTNVQQCLVGFTVWRFYGTLSNPTQAWTASQINLPKWCQNQPPYAFYAPNPMDAHLGLSVGSPWAQASWQSPYHQTVVAAERNLLTTAPPFAYGGASCQALETNPNPLATFFGSGAQANTPAGAAIQDGLYNIYQAWLGFGPNTALSVINANAPTPSSPSTINYGVATPCVSGLQYSMSPTNPFTFGTCYIPNVRIARQDVNPNNPAQHGYGFFPQGNLGPRFSSAYSQQPYVNPTIAAWRATINASVHATPGIYPGSPNPYIASNLWQQPNSNNNYAAYAASQESQCVAGAGATNTSQTVTPNQPHPTGINITVHVPAIGQVGGVLHPATITATADGGLLCGATVCPPNYAQLQSLTYELQVQGTNNYNPCAGNTNCQYQVVSSTSSGNDRTMVVDFYAATQASIPGAAAGQQVQVRVVNASAQYIDFLHQTTTIVVCPTSHTFGTITVPVPSCTTVSTPGTIAQVGFLNPTVTYVGPNGAPTNGNFPVISASNIP